jgi:hypothetical protein
MRLHPVQVRLWRAVEAQHVVSTLRLLDHDPAAQSRLEELLEESKPRAPEALPYLLATPFRYASPRGSRFRAPGDPGVLYGAEAVRTACAEAGYWRWRFVRDSEGLTEISATPQTVFAAGVRGAGVDLRQPPWNRRRAEWVDPGDYGATQEFGRRARAAGAAVVVYESVRDPERGSCAAVLSPAALQPKRVLERETWFLTVTQRGVVWRREGAVWEFGFGRR